jgi:tetratricopeptide (TPR) repeat protein
MLQQNLDYDDLARFCMERGKYQSGLVACNMGLEVHGRNPALLVRRAQIYDALENYGGAIADCKAALHLNPPARVGAIVQTTLALALERSTRRPRLSMRHALQSLLHRKT